MSSLPLPVGSSSQYGINEVLFYSLGGSLEKTVILERYPEEITFRENDHLTRNEPVQGGIDVDRRSPSYFVVRDMSTGQHYTVVSGTFQHEGKRRSLALIDHNTWEVSYPSLPAACSAPHLEEDRLICLNRSTGMPEIHIYKISE